jgi:capsular polysaccharide biosynthesis protein
MNQQTDAIQLVDNDDEMEIDLVELLYYFRSKLIILLVAFLIGAGIAGAVTYYLITPKYTATAKMYMVSASSDSIVDLTDLNIGTSLSSDYEELIKIRPIFEEVIEEQHLNYTYEQLLSMVTIETITDTRILTITVESPSPSEAQVVANALAEKAEDQLPKLMDTSKPNIAEQAVLPQSKSSPSYSKNIALGAAVGLVLALAVLTFRFITDDTLKSAEDVEKAFGVMPLTVIPEGDVESISDKREKEIAKEHEKQRKARKKKK